MIDCLLLKSSAAIAAGGVSYTSQNLCQALRLINFAYSTRFALTFDPFGPSSLRGGHFSDFQLRVKHHFTMFFTSFFITTRVAFASPRRHGAHYREFLKPCNRENKKTYKFGFVRMTFERKVLFLNISSILKPNSGGFYVPTHL